MTSKDYGTITLYHYTDRSGALAINNTGVIQPSSNPNDCAFGNGVYLTSLGMDTSPEYIAENNWDDATLPTVRVKEGRTDYAASVTLPRKYVRKQQSKRDIYLYEGELDLNDVIDWKIIKRPQLSYHHPHYCYYYYDESSDSDDSDDDDDDDKGQNYECEDDEDNKQEIYSQQQLEQEEQYKEDEREEEYQDEEQDDEYEDEYDGYQQEEQWNEESNDKHDDYQQEDYVEVRTYEGNYASDNESYCDDDDDDDDDSDDDDDEY